MKPKVTVYITNHNYGSYIEQAIQSVLDQSMQDFELIIIDDGSTDKSLKIIARYETLDNVFIILQENKGLNVSNNIALKQARGKYIMRLDADDFLDKHALELMVSVLEKKPELAIVFPDYYLVDNEGEIITQVRRHNFNKDVTLKDQPAHGACTMIRRKVLLKIGGYDETFNRQDGYDLWLNIINDYSIENVNLPLFYYRQHGKNLTKDEAQLLETRSNIIAKHAKKKSDKNLSVLAIIPVRGSVIDPRSSPLKPLGQKALIDWTIDAALNSSNLKDVLLTTPDKGVLDHVKKKYGQKVLCRKRSIELARINHKLNKTLVDALNFYCDTHSRPDAIMILNIEEPFRTSMYIDKAINVMCLYNVESVIGVRMEDDIIYMHDGSGLKPRIANNGLRLERDDLYKKSGGITLVTEQYFLNEKKIVGGRIGHIQLDQTAAFSVQSELDWTIANVIESKH